MPLRSALYASEGPDLVHYSIDVDEATLARREVVQLPQDVQYAWPHPTSRFLYVGSSPGVDGHEHHVAAFRIAADGALAAHGEPVRLAHRPIHLTVDGSGRYLLIAYNRPSTATVHRITPDGHIGEPVPQPQDLDGGVFAHQIRLLASNRGAILVARGVNASAIRPEDPGSLKLYSFEDGVLRNAQSVAPNGGYGFGPRHVDFHPTKPWVYASLERQNELQVYGLEHGRMTDAPLFTKTLLEDPKNLRPRQLGGTIHVHPNGRYVYVANRADHPVVHDGRKVFGGGENAIVVFEVDQATGEPRVIQRADPHAVYIRCFALDASSRLLIGAARVGIDVLEDGVVRRLPRAVSVFRVGSDGKLTFARKYDVQSGAKDQVWMGIVRLPE